MREDPALRHPGLRRQEAERHAAELFDNSPTPSATMRSFVCLIAPSRRRLVGSIDGYQAATHWSSYEALDALRIDGVHGLIVADGNRRTSGGVTAGIDFGPNLLAELRGETETKIAQLMLEYDAEPPFSAGSPKTVEPEIVATAVGILKGLGDSRLDAMIATARRTRAERVQ
jgi:transcriptional regulator GlxA family with amidase domain